MSFLVGLDGADSTDAISKPKHTNTKPNTTNHTQQTKLDHYIDNNHCHTHDQQEY